MIDMKKVNRSYIGKEVYYFEEKGVITGWGKSHIYVDFKEEGKRKGTRVAPEYLSLKKGLVNR